MKKSLFLVAMLCSSTTFAAAGDSYFGGGYHIGDYEIDGLPSASPTALKLEIGKYLTDCLAIEGQFALGLGEDTVSVNGVDVDLEVEQAISIFLKGDVHLTESVNLYGLAGLTKGKVKASADGFGSTTDDDSGFSYGVGIESATQGGLIFSAEYIMYLSEDAYDYAGLNVGISKKF